MQISWIGSFTAPCLALVMAVIGAPVQCVIGQEDTPDEDGDQGGPQVVYSIAGTVRDARSKQDPKTPIEGATLTVFDKDGKIAGVAKSAKDGSYLAIVSGPGIYIVEGWKKGYIPQNFGPVEVPEGKPYTGELDVELIPFPTTE